MSSRNDSKAGAAPYSSVLKDTNPQPSPPKDRPPEIIRSQFRDTSDAANLKPETAHVLFMDIVAYSKLLTDEQPTRQRELTEIVRATTAFQKAHKNELLILPTGDGMALTFFTDPEAPVHCAVEISRALRTHPQLKLRMGIHTGLVYRVADINENLNISGGGINIAQRVMDCGDAGHILLSKRVADDLGQLSQWANDLHDQGETEVKHGVPVHIYNLFNHEIGNAAIPAKLRISRPKSRMVKLLLLIAALSLVLVIALIWLGGQRRTSSNESRPPVPIERSFTFFLTPSKNKEPNKLYAGDEIFPNGSKFTLVMIPKQDGAFYLINQGPGSGGKPVLNVLFPTPQRNEGSAMLKASQRLEVPLQFDEFAGDELISIIWTKLPIPELDAIFKEAANSQPRFEVKKPAYVATVLEFINRNQSELTKSETNSEKKETIIRGPGEVIITTRVLKHRDSNIFKSQ